MSYNVNIVPATKTYNITHLSIICMNLNLYQSAKFMVDIFTDSGYPIERQYIELTKEEYLEWNNDDQYIINLVCARLGFTPSTEQVI
jgi:hypothetical protein